MTAESPTEARRPGQRPVIDGRYEVIRELGRGGMGVVHHVYDRATERELALKQLVVPDETSSVTGEERSSVRFRREFHTVAGLSHPCVVAAYEYGTDEGKPYYTMELLEGPTLSELLMAPVPQCCKLLRGIASALAFLHSRRLLHRDLKARNVRCDAAGRPRLLDFGVLATMGITGDVAGTPPYIPPEAMWSMPLDARADLFGLGALAYRLLTGRHAYPARTVDDLDELWKQRVDPPSRLREEIPPALDDLVMNLLAIQATGRPSTAAEVIARLDAIAGVERPPERAVAQGWLQSARLVGRMAELRRIRGVVEATTQGQGTVLIIEGASGVGKTRLLREAGLRAQLAGTTVLRARGRDRGKRYRAYDVVRQLVTEMWRVCPDEARRTGRPRGSVLGAVIPELRPGSSSSQQENVAAPPAEERLRLQQELMSWFIELSELRPLVLLVDDLEHCDEGSIRLLAALGLVAQRHALAIIGCERTDVPPSSTRTRLGEVGQRLRLPELPREAVAELVRDWFGDLPQADELARWIHGAAGGSPMHCFELVRHLVEERIVLYAEGIWRLVADPEELLLPERMTEALDRRLEHLSAEALALGQALALWRGPASVERCAELLDVDELSSIFEAIDELAYEGVIVGGDGAYELAHDGLREALLRRLGPDDRRRIHARSAEIIVERWGPKGGERQADLGWHLLRAGRRREGVALLERAGRRCYAMRSFEDAVELLEAALEIYREDDLPGDAVRALELQTMLVRAGVVGERAVVIRYAEVTIDSLAELGGLPLARRLASVVGRRLGLAVGLGVAYLRWWTRGRSKRGPSPRRAITMTVALANYTASVYAMAFDFGRVAALRERVELIRSVRSEVAQAALAMLDGFVEFCTGCWQEAHRHMDHVLLAAERSELASMAEMDRRMFVGGARALKVVMEAIDQAPSFGTSLAALQDLSMRFFELGAEMSRVCYLRLRGEEERARSVLRGAEASMVQLGNSWAFQTVRAWVTVLAHGLTEDVVELRRAVDELERLDRAGMGLSAFVSLARAEIARMQDDGRGARSTLETALADLPQEHRLLRLCLHASLVDVLVDLEQHDRAIGVAEQALRDAPAGTGPRPARVRLRCRLAVALAQRERLDDAEAEIDELVRESEAIDNPLLVGMVHEAGYEVATLRGRVAERRHHAARTELMFSSTGNPVLIARARRLVAALPAPVFRQDTGPLRAASARLDADAIETVDL